MFTTRVAQDNRLFARLRRLRDNVLDLDIVVDDYRDDLARLDRGDQSFNETTRLLSEAITARNRAADILATFLQQFEPESRHVA